MKKTKFIFILIAKTEKSNPTEKELDDSVEQLITAASILEERMKLEINEGEYFNDGTSLMLR